MLKAIWTHWLDRFMTTDLLNTPVSTQLSWNFGSIDFKFIHFNDQNIPIGTINLQ